MVFNSVVRVVARLQRSGFTSQASRAYSTGKDRLYTKKHEWVSVADNVGTVGVSDYAQDALGEVVFVQLPDAGQEVAAGEECGALESVKAASEVYSPVSGTIAEKNASVEKSPSLINKSPFGEGWLFRVRLSRPEELKELMDQTAYEAFLRDAN